MKIVAFEGIDNSGKSTQIRLLSEFLLDKGIKHICVKEPGSTSLGEKIRDILLHDSTDICSRSEALLFLAARAQNVNDIIARYGQTNTTLIVDRFIDSTLAYQGYGNGLDVCLLYKMNMFATQNITPSITFFMDIPISTAIQRQRKKDKIESRSIEYYEKVYNGYKTIIDKLPYKHVIIDADRSIEDIRVSIIDAIVENNIIGMGVKMGDTCQENMENSGYMP